MSLFLWTFFLFCSLGYLSKIKGLGQRPCLSLQLTPAETGHKPSSPHSHRWGESIISSQPCGPAPLLPSARYKALYLVDALNGEGNGTPLQYSCLENPMDRGAWWATVHGVAKSRTGLRDFTFTFHFHALEKEMAIHSSVLAWRIPGTVEPDGLPSMGFSRQEHWSGLPFASPMHESEK